MDAALLERFGKLRVIPVVAIEDSDHALGLADALLEGGLPVAEITFRTAAAAEVIATLHERRPELLLGAGTVLDFSTLDRARAAGASFALAPGLAPPVVRRARHEAFPFFPGAMTPSEFQTGFDLGANVFKFFPAVPAGGLPYLRAIMAPLAPYGLRVIPTGGITTDNLGEWLREPGVLAVGGTWIATRADLAAEDWPGIRKKVRTAVALATEAGTAAAAATTITTTAAPSLPRG